jgi:hypothetical protein
MTTLAHNSLLVDAEGQAVCTAGADGRVAAYFDSPGYGYTVGDASDPDVYGGRLAQFDRRILFIKPGFVVVHDLVASSGDPAEFDWLLHAVVPIETDAEEKSFTIECEQGGLRGRFLLPARLRIAVKSGFPVEPVNRYSTDPVPPDKYFPEWILHAAPEEPAAEAEFLAAIQIRRLGAEGEPEARIKPIEAENALGVCFELGDRTHRVILRKRGAPGLIRSGGLESDGDAAAVELTADGEIAAAFAANARSLRYGGEELFRSDKAQNWATPER